MKVALYPRFRGGKCREMEAVRLAESNFKMLERAPQKLPNMKSFLEVFVSALKEDEKVYGATFTNMVIKYVLKAVSRLTGEEAPSNIKTLDEAAGYLLSKADRIRPDYLIIWAHFVTINKLEGHLGVGEHILDMGISKKIVSTLGEQLTGLDVDSLMSAIHKALLSMEIAPFEMGYRKNDDGSIDLIYRDCYLMDGCQMSLSSGLNKRPDGRMVCGFSAGICKVLGRVTGSEWDYTVTKFEKPTCIVRCFEL